MKFAVLVAPIFLAIAPPALAQTVYTTAASFSTAIPSQTNSFNFPPTGSTLSPSFTQNGVTFNSALLYGYNDGGFGNNSYIGSINGSSLTVTSDRSFGLNLGSYNAAQTVTYTFGGTSGTLNLAMRPTTSFIGFSNNGSPTSVTFTFTNANELDVISFLTSGSAAPEPATWGLMLLGFGVVGAAMRRRKRAVTSTVFRTIA